MIYIVKELDVKNHNFGHLILILLLRCLVQSKRHSLAVYNNKLILGCLYSIMFTY